MRILNVLTRRCVPLDAMEPVVTFYERLIGQPRRLSFDYSEQRLKLAQVASILFIGGTAESLAPFRVTDATFLVADIDGYALDLPTQGVEILTPPKDVPTGRNMLVRHPDGMVVEYVEHRDKHPADVMASGGGSTRGRRPPVRVGSWSRFHPRSPAHRLDHTAGGRRPRRAGTIRSIGLQEPA